MRAGIERGLRLALLVGTLAGCGAQRASGTQGSVATPATTAEQCVRGTKGARFREMTWTEYYADVRERAWRNNAIVIWITPPKVKKKPVPAAATACVR